MPADLIPIIEKTVIDGKLPYHAGMNTREKLEYRDQKNGCFKLERCWFPEELGLKLKLFKERRDAGAERVPTLAHLRVRYFLKIFYIMVAQFLRVQRSKFILKSNLR